MYKKNDKSKFLLGIMVGLLVSVLVVNIENIKIMKEIHNTLAANNQQTVTNNEVIEEDNEVANNDAATDVKEPEVVFKELPDAQQKTVGVTNTIYTNYYTLSDQSLKETHPYVKDYDLIEYGCPICGYQLYCFDSAGSAAVACLRCTNCDWESKEVHIKNCTDSLEAKNILLDLFEKGELIKDVEFQHAYDYKWY